MAVVEGSYQELFQLWLICFSLGRAYVEANYDINKLNDRQVEIYQKLINDR
jgi:hypothetical protein